MEIIKIPGKLFLAALVISIPPPDLHFNNALLPAVIDNNIHPLMIARLRFHITVSDAVNNRFQIEKEKTPAILLQKSGNSSDTP